MVPPQDYWTITKFLTHHEIITTYLIPPTTPELPPWQPTMKLKISSKIFCRVSFFMTSMLTTRSTHCANWGDTSNWNDTSALCLLIYYIRSLSWNRCTYIETSPRENFPFPRNSPSYETNQRGKCLKFLFMTMYFQKVYQVHEFALVVALHGKLLIRLPTP